MTTPGADLCWYDDSGEPEGVPAGSVPVLVLLHAFPLDSSTWDRLVPLLAPQVRVVRVDLPGLGRSAARGVGEPSVAAMAAEVARVLDHLGVDRAAVHGVSTGGYVALALAAAEPQRVSALLLSSTTPWVGEPDVPAQRLATAAELERRGDTGPVAGSVDGALGPTARREQPDLADHVAGVIAAADPRGVAWVARALASRADTSRVLADFDGPVLLLYGAEDSEVPEGTVAGMADLRAGGAVTQVEVLPATGHLVALEQPGQAARALLAVLLGA